MQKVECVATGNVAVRGGDEDVGEVPTRAALG